MITEKREYLAPEAEAMNLSIESNLLTGSENQIPDPTDYIGGGEGWIW